MMMTNVLYNVFSLCLFVVRWLQVDEYVSLLQFAHHEKDAVKIETFVPFLQTTEHMDVVESPYLLLGE